MRTLRPLRFVRLTPHYRCFTATPSIFSGHSRWSKIKHDKAKNDSRRGAGFSKLSAEITFASKEGGATPGDSNLRLSVAIASAKKAGMAKDRIQAAIDRGQGKSPTGASLEPLTVEAIYGGVAVVVDILTDNRLRALQDTKAILTKHGAQLTPTSYLFSRNGVVTVTGATGGVDQVLEVALELEGVEEVEEGDDAGEVVILTEPGKMISISEGLRKAFDGTEGIEVKGRGVEWIPNQETAVELGSENQEGQLEKIVDKLEDCRDVAAVWANVK